MDKIHMPKPKDIIAKAYLEGLTQGLKIAKDIAKREGYEFIYPQIVYDNKPKAPH